MHNVTPAAAGADTPVRLRRFTATDGKFPAWMDPLEEPRWLDAAGAVDSMRPGDAVVGLEFDGRAWALPYWIMKNHHVANLVLDGRPVMVTLCEVCSSAAAFDPVMDGRSHRFKLEGLYNGTIMPTDVDSGSLWTGFTGEAIEGPMKGRTLPRLPLVQCTWAEWLALHPGSLVPEGTGEPRDGHGAGQSPGSPLVQLGMRRLLSHVDLRMPHYELVLGVLAGTQSRCYPLSELAALGPVLNDTLGGEEIAVFCLPGTWAAIAYSRRLDDHRLTFRAEGGTIVDAQTGSRWDLCGRASAGPLAGRRLRYVYSGVEEFFIWAAFYPATGIHGPAGAPGARPPKVWSVERVPEAIHLATTSLWEPGTKVLATGCGTGMIAAWMAERGLDVFAVDADAQDIERARRSFRGLAGLEFAVADLRLPHAFARQFDAVADHGYFAALPENERAAYAANLAAATRPGAVFLLLVPVAANKSARLLNYVRRSFEPAFEVTGLMSVPLPHPRSGKPGPGDTFRLVRR